MVLRNTLTSSNGLKLEGHVLETGITQQRRGDTKERSGRCRFMRAGARQKKGDIQKRNCPIMSLRWNCACVAIVHCGACREGDGHCGKTDSFPIAFDCRMGLTGDGGWGVL